MKRIINHALVALTALLIGASNTKLCAATFSDDNWISMNPSIPGADGPDDAVSAMVVDGSGNLYIGGGSTAAGGVIANGVAKWNGSSWSALGLGMDYAVYALAVSGSNLYAGGDFITAGGIAATNIAKWNGTSWNALGLGMDTRVYALAVSDSDLYAGGEFQLAGGRNANFIAKWNGSRWRPLGSGMSSDLVSALAISGSDLYVGGGFAKAGGKDSASLARARIGSTVKSVAAANSTASIQLSGVTGYPYDVQRATNLTPPVVWTTLNSASLYPAADGSFTFTDTNAAQGHAFYRAAAISLAPTACPRLGVQQPAGTNVSSGDSIFFGAVAVGSSVTKTFTITNSGTGPLIISDVSTFWISEFVVNTTGMVTNVPAGGSTTFTVKFSPTAAGTGRVTLYVIADTTDCSDSDEGYFNLTVSGAGL